MDFGTEDSGFEEMCVFAETLQLIAPLDYLPVYHHG